MALGLLLSGRFINPYNADLNTKIGVCYLNWVNKENAFSISERLSTEKDVSKRIHLFLGRGYQLNYQWDSAITEYNEALKIGLESRDKESGQVH